MRPGSGRVAAMLFCCLACNSLCGIAQESWQARVPRLMTRWTAEVTPETVHSEYPRPQMVRDRWLNLNGLWEYTVRPRQVELEKWARADGQILVPFSITSALSGVMSQVDERNRLWYRRSFSIPDDWRNGRVLLHFGAVDWEASVRVNGELACLHRGGYTPFSCDISPYLVDGNSQELVVSVWDPTDSGYQPRGKQVRNPRGIWYTPTTGIWQTVWIEPVPKTYIRSIRLTPDLAQDSLFLEVVSTPEGQSTTVQARVKIEGEVVVETTGSIGDRIQLLIPDPNLWSPSSPFLYDLEVSLLGNGETIDTVESYFGMREIGVEKDTEGIPRLFLNGEPIFQYGLLDQGFWPDGIYTAPTDEALRYDIEVTKKLGFNMIRKHVKIEPGRWYYWADRLGVMVWQDMPSGDEYIGRNDPDLQRSAQSAHQFESELKEIIDALYNHPSIVMWVPFNEGWGQFDTGRIAQWIKNYDPSRLVNPASGWVDREVGDIHDVHSYPGPDAPPIGPFRAGVLGEFGGLGLPVKGHTWQSEDNWGYRSFESVSELTDAYLQLLEKLKLLIERQGLAAAVYTQTTDVEVEVNGMMTYDREIIKMDESRIKEANQFLYSVAGSR
ncbi:MAG TPA: glycoside hydrolase family 2 TIM barrel-domain containing protein [Acidobacteriota bacterium]|nr:glycoside hydrolase family 2 TIM barrel-domain containing protein [Acidobacteriota bacterium]